jgi:3-oxoacyl-[acyl-carrier protein] reductase
MNAPVAVVTGGARGLGLSIAVKLIADGYSLVLVDRDPTVEETGAQLRTADSEVVTCVADLTSDDDIMSVRETVSTRFGRVDALVNNAGITRDARLSKMDRSSFSRVIGVNLVSPMVFSGAMHDLMVPGSAVVNMSSRAALGNFGQTNYVSAKSGLIGFTRALALRWAPNVRVNAVAPGLIDSEMSRAMPTDVLAGLVAKVPAGRIGRPDDIANAVAFLVSDSAAYITGQVLTVCGGRSVAP